MVTRCPQCGRSGNLPDKLAASDQIVRCRKCSTRFALAAVAINSPKQAFAAARGSNRLPPSQSSTDSAFSDGFFAGADDDDPVENRRQSPSESRYEFPDEFIHEDDASFGDWSADDVPAHAVSPTTALVPLTTPHFNPTTPLPSPWYEKLIHASGHVQFFSAIGFTALSISIIACLIYARATSALAPENANLTVVVGTVAAISLLMFGLSTTALNLILIDIARNIHRLREYHEHNAKLTR